VWTETLVDLSTVDYMAFPRLLALAELGWSPSARRADGSPADRSFLSRIAEQGGRLMAAGVNFYPSTQVRWQVQATGSTLAGTRGRVSGTVATVAAPGFAPGSIAATVSWGDGHTSRPGVAGRAPTGIRVNSLYTVHGEHHYAHPGVYHGHVTVRARTGPRSPCRSPSSCGNRARRKEPGMGAGRNRVGPPEGELVTGVRRNKVGPPEGALG
jgi:hexosaminidase